MVTTVGEGRMARTRTGVVALVIVALAIVGCTAVATFARCPVEYEAAINDLCYDPPGADRVPRPADWELVSEEFDCGGASGRCHAVIVGLRAPEAVADPAAAYLAFIDGLDPTLAERDLRIVACDMFVPITEVTPEQLAAEGGCPAAPDLTVWASWDFDEDDRWGERVFDLPWN